MVKLYCNGSRKMVGETSLVMISLAASEITGARARARRASNPDLRARWRYTVKTNQRPVTPVRVVVLPAIPLLLLPSDRERKSRRKCGSRNRASKRINELFFPPFLPIIIVALRIASRTNV